MSAGSITKVVSPRTGKISWLVRVEFPPNKDGRRSQKSKTCRTKGEAERIRTAWLSEIDGGTAVVPDTITTASLLTEWLEHMGTQNRVRPRTLAEYRRIVEQHVIPRIGALPVQKLTPVHVERMLSNMTNDDVGARTMQLCHMRLSQALDWAMRMGYVRRNVAKLVERPTVEKRADTIWSPAQATAFLAKAGPWRPLFELILATGMRRGEALGLHWSDFDEDAGTIRVRRSLSIMPGQGLVLSEPKTETSKRFIQLDPETTALLKAHRLAQAERQRTALDWTETPYMFTNGRGGPLFPDNVLRAFHRIAVQAGVPPIRLHDLRHTHASWLLLSKEAPQVVSERLGHANPAILLRIYAHTLRNSQDSAATLFDTVFRSSATVREEA